MVWLVVDCTWMVPRAARRRWSRTPPTSRRSPPGCLAAPPWPFGRGLPGGGRTAGHRCSPPPDSRWPTDVPQAASTPSARAMPAVSGDRGPAGTSAGRWSAERGRFGRGGFERSGRSVMVFLRERCSARMWRCARVSDEDGRDAGAVIRCAARRWGPAGRPGWRGRRRRRCRSPTAMAMEPTTAVGEITMVVSSRPGRILAPAMPRAAPSTPPARPEHDGLDQELPADRRRRRARGPCAARSPGSAR